MLVSRSACKVARRSGFNGLRHYSSPKSAAIITLLHNDPPSENDDVLESVPDQHHPVSKALEKFPTPQKALPQKATPLKAASAVILTTPLAPRSKSGDTKALGRATSRFRSNMRDRKSVMKLTAAAVKQLSNLLDQPDSKLIKVGVRNRGCSGLAYHLEYVDKAGALDEIVEQGGVKVLVDSKTLFSIIGSEMDWVEDKLNQQFVFRNPNIKQECGCGESSMV